MMSSKSIVFITGANTGLGLEAVKAFCRSNKSYEVIIGCRSTEKGEKAIEEVKKEYPQTSSSLSVVQADVSSDDSITKAFETISSKFGKVDTLINNAGAGFDRQIQDGSMTIRQAWTAAWDTNVAGTQVLTTMFVPLLLKSSDPRLIFITSGTSALSETERFDIPAMARINESPPAGWPKERQLNPITCYRSSKTGLNMLMREWYKILKNDGVKLWCISPGFLATGLSGVGGEQLKKVR